jgi:hypothetical protein
MRPLGFSLQHLATIFFLIDNDYSSNRRLKWFIERPLWLQPHFRKCVHLPRASNWIRLKKALATNPQQQQPQPQQQVLILVFKDGT